MGARSIGQIADGFLKQKNICSSSSSDPAFEVGRSNNFDNPRRKTTPHTKPPKKMITGLAHVNLTVPPDTLQAAKAFYADTLGLTPRTVPSGSEHRLAWFDIGSSGQQVHVACYDETKSPAGESPRHPCFKLESPDKLVELRKKIYEHFERGGPGAPVMADRPGNENSGSQGQEYPDRFFARDYAGNRLEFSL